MSSPITPNIQRAINLVGNAFRVKFVTVFQPAMIKSINIIATTEEDAEKKIVADGVALREERKLIAVELAVQDVYL